MKIGFLPIARTTFDIPFAEDQARVALDTLRDGPHTVIGGAELQTDDAAVTSTAQGLADQGVGSIVVLQASFADSSLAVAASAVGVPLILWAFSEPRTGGRLRLNSFCGINLAGYTLTQLHRPYSWIHAQPDDHQVNAQIGVSHQVATSAPKTTPPTDEARSRARSVVARLRDTTIGRVGERPDGFEPCGYVADTLRSTLGVSVSEVELPELFTRAAAADEEAVALARERSEAFLDGMDAVDQGQLDHSLRINAGLRSLIEDGGWSGVATRCWPETFTDFGGAACTPMAMLTEDGTPGSCEADVYGNITGLVMTWLSGSASFVADLVDIDHETNTGVFWHCGLAPFEMADPASHPTATVHSNRKMPLLSEFPLKPGRITIARLSQSSGQTRMLIGSGEMLPEPLAFSGTAGVARFDGSTSSVVNTIMTEGLEHHYGLVYGDIRAELEAIADELGIDTIRLAG